MGSVLSVNVAVPHESRWTRARVTGIDKRPVRGPLAVTAPGPKGTGAVGLAGDRVYDVKDHGGDDQAVYAYAREDLDAWAHDLGRELVSGMFGENLTTLHVDVTHARIGERWRVGERLVLEVAGPRTPCRTFAGWMGEPRWVRRFTEAAMPGAYLRVVEPGEVEADDPIVREHRPAGAQTVADVFRAVMNQPT